jgi:hypothetical protein
MNEKNLAMTPLSSWELTESPEDLILAKLMLGE